MTAINYEKLGFKNAVEFAEYNFYKFDPKTQNQLIIMGIFPKTNQGGEIKKNKRKCLNYYFYL
jgi:hypothetical protein